jgi:hypothetical protein
MANDHAKRIEAQIREFRKHLTDLAAPTGFDEFISIIHRPGWTTPAEFTLVGGLLDAMIGNVRGLAQMKAVLLKGSDEVKATG